jgi:hypothetical protein
MTVPKISASLVISILATGALLNVAGSGTLGTQAQKIAQFITKGYGV